MAISTSNKTVGDLVPEVIDALQQRTDATSLAPRYIKRALEEITESYPFEELRRTGPQVQLTPNLATYPISTFVDQGQDYTSMESLVVFVDPPNNTVDFTLNYKTPKAIEMMLSPTTVGMPAYWSRFGANILLGPVPSQAYTMFGRYQIRHPFPVEESALPNAPIFIPSSWEEIVVYSAASRIALVKRWNDQRQVLHDILYGDPEYITSEGKRGRPGIMAARIFQVERDERFNSRRIGIIVPTYSRR